MTPQELRELDCWIATNVMGWKRMPLKEFVEGLDDEDQSNELTTWWHDANGQPIELVDSIYDGGFFPTREEAAAMMVLEKCAIKCWEHVSTLEIKPERLRDVREGMPRGWIVYHYDGPDAYATTLPLAICLFAKKLFSQ